MAEKISITKGFDNDTFDTYVPELSDNADIQNAFELFYYGDSTDGNTVGDVSLHANIVDFDSRITSATSQITGHTGAISDVHGVGAGNSIVGTGTTQTLTNKTLTSPAITSPTVTGTAVLPSTTSIGNVSSTEISYVDGVTSSIQTQLNTNTPTGMISIHSASVAPTGWLLCDGTSYASASYTTLFNVIGYTFGGSGANFNVPNLKGKVVVGIDGAQVEFDTRGETGGAMTHQHAASNSGDSTPTTSGASAGNTTNGASAGNTTNGASDGNNTGYQAYNAGLDNTTSNNSANHTHSFDTPSASDTSNAPSSTASPLGSVSHSGYTHVYGYTPAASSTHTHGVTVNPAADDTENQSANHTHTVDSHYHATTDHTHNTTDHTHTTTDHTHTALHSHTTPASSSLSNLQPYMALNYIIKI